MAFDVGTRLGPYEIVALVGAGESGDVYKATDTRVNRTVAIKTLPPQWAEEPAAKERFEEEALTVARLSHPHICALHDIGRERPSGRLKAAPASEEVPTSEEVPSSEDAGEIDFVVLEYLEGQTLAARLEKGAMPLHEAVTIAIAIADALDKAHQKGVVHRDLKPSNVMLTATGAKLLDFGFGVGRVLLAGPAGSARQHPAYTLARTMPADVAGVATVTGTLQYLAPEQLEGKAGDARTDIFALGAILYEMVTGATAFEGKNQTLLIAAIVSLELDPLSKARPGTPPALDHVAKRCLEKNPDDRWQTAHDLGVQLRWISEGGAVLPSATPGRDRLVQLALAAAVVLAAVTSVSAFVYVRGVGETEAFQFRVPFYGVSQSDISISPDGETLALVARPDPPEAAALYVRPVGTPTFRRVAGTEDAAQPFWSPDSRSIAFVAGGRLKKVEASGGPPQNVAEVQGFMGGTWTSDTTIVYGSAKGLFRVSSEGGTPAAITAVEKTETGHFWPSFLPDGRHYTYLAWSAEVGNRALLLGTLDSTEKKRLMALESNAAYAAGYLVYHREATLFAQAFDADRLELSGDPLHIADELAFNATNGRGSFDVSQSGALLYYQGQGGPSGRGQTVVGAQFGWRDRTGTQLALAGDAATYGDVDLSPDAKLLAVTRQEAGAPGADIWVTDWQRGAATRLTLDPADDINPVWSHDGLRVAFTSFRKGNADIYVKNANGVGAETPLLESSANEFIEDWSKDGQHIAYKLGQDAFEDIYALPLAGDKKPIPVVQGPFRKDEAQFSYDGKWLAYTSDESGAFQVYVIEFPGGKERHQVSTTGGGQPRWTGDGKHLYYRAPDNGIMEVDLTLGTRIESAVPRRLFFATQLVSAQDLTRHQWNITRDGTRLLVRFPNNTAGGLGQAVGALGGAGVPFNFPGSAGQAVGIGRGNNFTNFPPLGLTVIRHWTSLFQETAK